MIRDIKAGNLEAIAYHLEIGEDNGGISKDVLAAFLRGVASELNRSYGYDEAINDLDNIQFTDNTWQEAMMAKAGVVAIICKLCGKVTGNQEAGGVTGAGNLV